MDVGATVGFGFDLGAGGTFGTGAGGGLGSGVGATDGLGIGASGGANVSGLFLRWAVPGVASARSKTVTPKSQAQRVQEAITLRGKILTGDGEYSPRTTDHELD
ncbi:hypothetical protein CORC01_10514 [Colletotrichum orchidophilum]|uniref:Uncharacterized protein n=1 Tax=Colletotrichum orchidophilum TaxID=1209926 RepID=A0A1G4AYI0_9PEZI|nr:uncharacterized protein CORC01_10514 [Colletotrichum orchidophilum]OHE94176.1 hypothetical protein CORC01_10514 [Colletotrichum orchidophilum]